MMLWEVVFDDRVITVEQTQIEYTSMYMDAFKFRFNDIRKINNNIDQLKESNLKTFLKGALHLKYKHRKDID